MTTHDDSFDVLVAEVLADPIAGAAFSENEFRRRLAVAFDTARKTRGLSIRDLAQKMNTSLSQVQRLLHLHVGGESSLTLRTIFRAAHVLDLDVMAHIRAKNHGTACDNVVAFGNVAWTTNASVRPAEENLGASCAIPATMPEAADRPWRTSPKLETAEHDAPCLDVAS